jgi:hypothetical protein
MARQLKRPIAIACAFIASMASSAGSARGDDSTTLPAPTVGVVRPKRSALAAGAAIVPGILVHGSGHFVAGDAPTGRKLLALEGAAVGTLAVGFVPLVLSGASRRIVGPAAALSVVGVGLFAISTLADLYGVLAPPGGVGAPFRLAPSMQAEMGYRYVYDPVFSYRHFSFYELDGRAGSWRAHPSAWFDLEGTTSRVRVPIAFRFAGPTPKPAEPSIDGSYLEIEAALTRHADLPDRFVTTTGELSVQGRLDMQRFAPSLTGSFAELGLGWALQRYGYEVKGVPADVGELLLARFGYGMYVGWPGGPRGEAMLYYDHRHDDFAAGLKLSGIPSGVAGHFGFSARAFLSEHWGMSVEAMAGSAYVTGASILFRQGGGT